MFNLGNLFKIMFCTHPKPSEEKIHLIKIEEHLGTLSNKMQVIERAIERDPLRRRSNSVGPRRGTFSDNLSTVTENEEDEAAFDSETDHDSFHGRLGEGDHGGSSSDINKPQRDDLLNPYWIEDKDLKVCR